MTNQRLPRSGGAAQVALAGDVWDMACDMIERALNLSAAWPLSVSASDSGAALSCEVIAPTRLKIFDKRTRGGCYKAHIMNPPAAAKVDFDSNVVTAYSDVAQDGKEVIVINQPEIDETNVTHGLANDTIVWGFRSFTTSSTDTKPVYEISTEFIGKPLVCALTEDGGSDGNKTTAVSWTYTVKDLGGVTLGSSMVPQSPATRLKGTHPAATFGLGYFDASQTFQLLVAYEGNGFGSC